MKQELTKSVTFTLDRHDVAELFLWVRRYNSLAYLRTLSYQNPKRYLNSILTAILEDIGYGAYSNNWRDYCPEEEYEARRKWAFDFVAPLFETKEKNHENGLR